MNYLVIDFGGTLVKYSVMNEQGEVHIQGEDPAPVASKEQFIRYISVLFEKYKRMDLGGIAISMPGVIDEKKCFVKSAGAYIELYGMELGRELEEIIPVPVTVENDGKCGSLAEVWKGNLSDCSDGIVLILGTGVAGGIIKDRMIHKGAGLIAGEFSYLLLGETPSLKETALGRCSVSTLLFNACRVKGIDLRKMPNYPLLSKFMDCKQILSDWDRDPKYQKGMDGYQFFELLEDRDEDIAKLYEAYTADLAKLIYNLQLTYSPEKYCLEGESAGRIV